MASHGFEPGPWLGKLKQRLLQGDESAQIQLPDGSVVSAGALSMELVLISAGKKLVYAIDFADTEHNRQRLVAFARQAHTLFCEAAFLEEHREHAVRHGHLTTRACGEIAAQAGVTRLVPFHFSRRYEDDPQLLYEELSAVCSCVVMPKSMAVF